MDNIYKFFSPNASQWKIILEYIFIRYNSCTHLMLPLMNKSEALGDHFFFFHVRDVNHSPKQEITYFKSEHHP